MNLETKSFHLFEIDECRWKIIEKQKNNNVGLVCLSKVNDIVQIEKIKLDDDYLKDDYVLQIMESLCNVVFYRMKVRKLCTDLNENDLLDKVCLELGFHHDVDDKSTIYREEYLLYLQKKGKALNFEKLDSIRIVFLMVAFFGLVLLGVDMMRNVNNLWTSLYAYLTGIGVAGAIFSTYMSSGKGCGEKDKGKKNAG